LQTLLISELGNSAVWVAAVVGAAVTVITAIAWVVKWLINLAIKTNQFIKDWNGEPEDDTIGEPAHPGVLKRLKAMEERQLGIEHILTPNGGSSLADAVNRIDRRSDMQERLLRAHLQDGEYLLQVGIENDKAEREALANEGIVFPYIEVQYDSLRATRVLRESMDSPDGEAPKA
jgi:hypothetical protein